MTDIQNPFYKKKEGVFHKLQEVANNIRLNNGQVKELAERKKNLKSALGESKITDSQYKCENTKLMQRAKALRQELQVLSNQKKLLLASFSDVGNEFDKWEQEVRAPRMAKSRADHAKAKEELEAIRAKRAELQREAKYHQSRMDEQKKKIQSLQRKYEENEASIAKDKAKIGMIVDKAFGVDSSSRGSTVLRSTAVSKGINVPSNKQRSVNTLFHQSATTTPQKAGSKVSSGQFKKAPNQKEDALDHGHDSAYDSQGSSGGDSPGTSPKHEHKIAVATS